MFKMHIIQFSVSNILSRPFLPNVRTLTHEKAARNNVVVECGTEHKDNKSLFIFGLGYSGIGVANYFQNRGWKVIGTVRTNDKRDQLRSRGFEVYKFAPDEYELLGGKALQYLKDATHVLSTVPPTEGAMVDDPVLMAHMRMFGDNAHQYEWIGYVSSTSVYGDHKGEWVTEQSEARASSGKGFVRLKAEQQWLQLHYNYSAPVHVFRCGGIYGPRRSAIEAVRQKGVPSSNQQRRAQERYTSRVHVYDICRTLEASILRPNPGAIYNIVDDNPANRLEVMEYAAQLLVNAGYCNTLPSCSTDTSVGRGADGAHTAQPKHAAACAPVGKRVSNQRIKGELKVQLTFPSFLEGFDAIIKEDMRPFD